MFTGRGAGDDRAELFVVAEGTTPAGEAFAGHVVSALGQLWATLDQSLTGSIRRLFEEADRNLRDWNAKSIAQHHVALGLTCLARRGPQVVIGQAGPTVAFHFSGGAVRAIFPDDEHRTPLGADGNEPQLERLDLAPGDRVLLLSTPAVRTLGQDLVEGILSLPREQVLRDLYYRVREMRHVTALLVSARPEGSEREEAGFVIGEADGGPVIGEQPRVGGTDAAEHGHGPGGIQPSLFIDGGIEEEMLELARKRLEAVDARPRHVTPPPRVAVAAPAPLVRAVGDDEAFRRMAEERAARAARWRREANVRQPEPMVIRAPEPQGAGPGRRQVAANLPEPMERPANGRRERRQSFSRGLVRGQSPPRPAHATHDAPLVSDLAEGRRARPVASQAGIEPSTGMTAPPTGTLVRVRPAMSGRRWKGGGSLGGRSTVSGHLPPTWLIILIGLSVLIGLVGFITVPNLLEEETAQRQQQLVGQAEAQLATALVQPDPAEKRKLLNAAHAMLLEAVELDQADPRAQELVSEVAGVIAAMDAVIEPAVVETITSLAEFGDNPVAVTRMAASDTAAYLLDTTGAQVLAVDFATGAPEAIYRAGGEEQLPRPVALTIGDVVELGGEVLLIADERAGLWAYAPGGAVRPVPLAAMAGMSITDIAVANQELYVLDAPAATIYRFVPSDSGFGAEPDVAVKAPELAAARRLLVDSEIITVSSDGTVRRFAGEVSLALAQSGIDKPLVAAAAPHTVAPDGELYLVDGPNDRIVVFARNGTFVRQYRHADFKGITSMAIRNGTAYIFSGATLRRVVFE